MGAKPETLKSVCVFCGSSDAAAPAHLRAAADLGRALAEADLRLVYGGGGVGLMGATARAAHEAGGKVLGIIPDFLVGVVLVWIVGVHLHWLPVAGRSGVDSFVLPVLSLAIGPAAVLSRILRVEMIGVLQLINARDPAGRVVPRAAHIRKVYPRDSQTRDGGESETQTHRLLRRGIPYGPSYDGTPASAAFDRGRRTRAYGVRPIQTIGQPDRRRHASGHLGGRNGGRGPPPVGASQSGRRRSRVVQLPLDIARHGGDAHDRQFHAAR